MSEEITKDTVADQMAAAHAAIANDQADKSLEGSVEDPEIHDGDLVGVEPVFVQTEEDVGHLPM